MHFIAIFMSFLLLSCTTIETYPAPERFEEVEQASSLNKHWKDRFKMRELSKRAVRIHYSCKIGENLKTIGSGVVIKRSNKRSWVVTADHVVETIARRSCSIVVKDYKGLSGYAKAVKRNNITDIAILEVGEPIGSPAPLYQDVYLGQPITCVGWPMLPFKSGTDEMSITRGYVSTMNVKGFIRISADIYFGSSGGACFSNNGSVVGIVSHFMAGGFSRGPLPPRVGQFFISDVRNLINMLD